MHVCVHACESRMEQDQGRAGARAERRCGSRWAQGRQVSLRDSRVLIVRGEDGALGSCQQPSESRRWAPCPTCRPTSFSSTGSHSSPSSFPSSPTSCSPPAPSFSRPSPPPQSFVSGSLSTSSPPPPHLPYCLETLGPGAAPSVLPLGTRMGPGTGHCSLKTLSSENDLGQFSNSTRGLF